MSTPGGLSAGSDDRMVAIEAWEHTSISVENAAITCEFLCTNFGFAPVWYGSDWRADIQTYLGTTSGEADIIMLRSPRSEHILELIEFRKVPRDLEDSAPVRPGTGHLAFRVGDIDVELAKLSQSGASLVGAVQESPGVGRGCYVRIPGGIVIELTDLAEGVPQVGSATYVAQYGQPSLESIKTNDLIRRTLGGLLAAVGADRVTLRREPETASHLEEGADMPVVWEDVSDGTRRIRDAASLDIREGPTLPFMLAERTFLIVDDCDDSTYAPPAALRAVYGVDAEMLAPLFDATDRLVGMVSVHHCHGPRVWTDAEIGRLEECSATVAGALGLRSPGDVK